MTEPGVGAGDVDVASVAAVIGQRSRALVLMALADGRALPASMLAREAGVSAATVSEHLKQLLAADLVTVEQSGRARYYRLGNPQVAAALEALAQLAPRAPVRSLREGTRMRALRRSRTCYGHLAGQLGVALMDALLEHELLVRIPRSAGNTREAGDRLAAPGSTLTFQLTTPGHDQLAELGVQVSSAKETVVPIRYCVDWSEQRPHLSGALGRGIADRLISLDWIRHANQHRVITVTPRGRDGLRHHFGICWE